MSTRNFTRRLLTILVSVVLIFALAMPIMAQRRGGSFGGGGRSFGGGSFGGGGGSRSFGGGSFGSRSSSSSSFGGGSPRSSSSSFGRPSTSSSGSSSFGRSNSSSFGRTGSFGSSGRINSTSINSRLPSSYSGYSYVPSTRIYYGGSYYPTYGYGGFWSGYSLGLISSPWTHWMPFSPAFYVDPPYYDGTAYYAGGFSFTRFLIGIVFIIVIFWIIGKIFRNLFGGGGGGRRVKYTVYK